ncbi:hypothetical protein Misp01_09290 [Microtetraspora sp. NBRC 13810]|uniref:SgcJ/EcaC family oxidoreductase n=1 Tax=Microtetraspora sp. NBRC 13810 TaxID=3030990 RepID=UPI0024A45D67|nr:SgcJ/EcaC family oxidoreductase [Microtetraspora sp. NBRC 13810]GLW05799.1 hypothetical protein Misp01_09290 [Microtetraspora sp. NBRC 13810]
MTNNAASLVTQAKQWATYYGDYPNGKEGAVLTVPLRVRAAVDSNDADGLAEVFTEDGSLLIGDTQLRGRDEIKSYMADAFAGSYKGTRLSEVPLEIRSIADDVAMAITQGGYMLPGESTVAPERQMRTMYVIVKREGQWRLFSQQSSPLGG